jgi:hypothetical protein
MEMNCGKVNKHSVQEYNKSVGLERPRVKLVEHALVDDRIPYGIPKKAIML